MPKLFMMILHLVHFSEFLCISTSWLILRRYILDTLKEVKEDYDYDESEAPTVFTPSAVRRRLEIDPNVTRPCDGMFPMPGKLTPVDK